MKTVIRQEICCWARSLLALLLALSVSLAARPVGAELLADAEALLKAYKALGAQSARLSTVFLAEGQSRTIATGSPAAVGGCWKLVAIAARHISFTLQSPALPGAASPKEQQLPAHQSKAGVAQIELCQPAMSSAAVPASAAVPGGGESSQRRGGPGLKQVTVTMASERGTIDILVATFRAHLPAVEAVLPQRALGPRAPRSELGKSLALAPLAARVARARASARRDGARAIVAATARATAKGTGSLVLNLAAGCHRLSVLAAAGDGDGVAVDVDAEVRLFGAKKPLRRDRSHAPDARLDFCLGKTNRVELRFLGAGGAVGVRVFDALWPLPEAIEASWSPRLKASIAWALHRRRAPALRVAPSLQLIGGAGPTETAVVLAPNACYFAAFGAYSGEASAGRLTVRVGGREVHDNTAKPPHSGAVSFCTGSERKATLRVALHGRAVWWRLVLWPLGR